MVSRKHFLLHHFFISVKNNSCKSEDRLYFVSCWQNIDNCSTAECIFFLKPQKGQNRRHVCFKKTTLCLLSSGFWCPYDSDIQWGWSGGDFGSQGTFSCVWRYFWLSQLGWRSIAGISRPKMLLTHPMIPRTVTRSKDPPQMSLVLLLRSSVLLGLSFMHYFSLAAATE
jgi:hypothetical protein